VQPKITSNLIIEQLPRELKQELASKLQPRWLSRGQELALGSDVVFPLGAIIALLDSSGDGITVEGGFVGFEGVLSLGRMPNIKAEVQVAGESLFLPRSVYEDFQDNRDFRRATDGFRDRLLTLAFQTSVCLVSHRTEQRLASSLVGLMDRSGQEQFDLTQEYLAALLGVTRPTLTLAAAQLQSKGLVKHRYGRVTILDAPRLANAACRCHREIRALIEAS